MRERYSKEIEARIVLQIVEYQDKVRHGRMDPDKVKRALSALRESPWGLATVTGIPRVAPKAGSGTEVVTLHVTWYTWRRSKWVRWRVFSMTIWHKEELDKLDLKCSLADKKKIWEDMFPERYEAMVTKRTNRVLRRLSIPQPEKGGPYWVMDTYPSAKMALICDRYHTFLCTPVGQIRVPAICNTVMQALESLKVRPEFTWEQVETQMVMLVLAD